MLVIRIQTPASKPHWSIIKAARQIGEWLRVKWCNFCQRANHDENVCHKKNPELQAKHRSAQSLRNQSSTNSSSSQGNKPSGKRRRLNPSSSTPDNNSKPVSFLAMPPIFDSCYMAIENSLNLLSDAWIWTPTTPDIYAITESFS